MRNRKLRVRLRKTKCRSAEQRRKGLIPIWNWNLQTGHKCEKELGTSRTCCCGIVSPLSNEARHRVKGVRGLSVDVRDAGHQYSGDCGSGAGERVEIGGGMAGAESRSGVTHTQTHSNTHTHTNTLKHTHIHTDTQIHTYTHTQINNH